MLLRRSDLYVHGNKMKVGGGSRKGSAFERYICKSLSLWWTNQERDDIFWRTAGSGGRATNRAKKGDTTAGAYGDIMALDPIGAELLKLCCFELKSGYKPDALDLIDKRRGSNPPVLIQFYQQAEKSAIQARALYPIVIFKRTSKLTCIMITRDFVKTIDPYVGRIDKDLCIRYSDYYIVTFDGFLNWCTPEAIKQSIKK